MENVKEKMSTAWEVTKEQVKNIWRFKCRQDEYSWSVKYLGCSCRRVGEGDGLGREGASCRSVRRILQSSEGFGGERAHHHGEDQDEDLWDLGGHQGAGLKQLKLPATKLNVHELSNFQAAQVLESVKEKVVEEPSHIKQLKLKMSEQWGFTKEQVYKILWINYHAP